MYKRQVLEGVPKAIFFGGGTGVSQYVLTLSLIHICLLHIRRQLGVGADAQFFHRIGNGGGVYFPDAHPRATPLSRAACATASATDGATPVSYTHLCIHKREEGVL